MDDLITFLNARYDEVEADAIAAAKATTRRQAGMAWLPGPVGEEEALYVGLSDLTSEWRCDQHTEVPNMCDDRQLLKVDQDFLHTPEETAAVMAHIARHDPSRVLADVEAKRRLLHAHEPFGDQPGMVYAASAKYCYTCGPGDHWQTEQEPDMWEWALAGRCPTVRILALPFTVHPDYKPEWSPDA